MTDRLKVYAVCTFAIDYAGAANRAFFQRLLFLSQRHRLVLLTLGRNRGGWPGAEAMEVRRYPAEPTAMRGGSLAHLLRWWFACRFAVWCLFILRKEAWGQGTVVHTFQNTDAVIGYLAKRLGCLWVADCLDMPDLYDEYVQTMKAKRKYLTAVLLGWGYFKLLGMRRIFRHADVVITTALTTEEGFARRLIDEYGVDPEKLVLTTNGTSLGLSTKTGGEPAGRGRRERGRPFRLLYVGSVCRERGVEVLLAAMAILREAGITGVVLDLVGPVARGYAPALEEAARRRQLNGGVNVRGFLPHPQALDLIEKADVCLFPFPPGPALDGVMPIKVYEYLAMGKIVVASDLVGVRSIIRDGVNGLLVRPDDPADLAAAVRRLWEDDRLYQSLQQAAAKSVEPFEWSRVHERLDQSLMANLLNRGLLSNR